MNVGENIKKFRELKSLTQAELAKKSKISKNALWNYENNKRSPSMDILNRIAQALDITLNELTGVHESVYEKYNQNLKKIGDNIRKQREEAGLTRKDLSKKISVPELYLAECELGDHKMGRMFLEKIAKALDISASDLYYHDTIHTDNLSPSILYDRVYDLYEWYYRTNNLENKFKLNSKEFMYQDQYFLESLADAIKKSINSNIRVYDKRLNKNDNTPSNRKAITFPYYEGPYAEFIVPKEETNSIQAQFDLMAKSYLLGEKYNDNNYLEFEIKRLAGYLGESFKNSLLFSSSNEYFIPEKCEEYYKKFLSEVEEILKEKVYEENKKDD